MIGLPSFQPWNKVTDACTAFFRTDAACWSLVRVSGRWPLASHGLQGLPVFLDCPGCGYKQATIVHVLCQCAAVEQHYRALQGRCLTCPSRHDIMAMLRFIVGSPQDSEIFMAVCSYVSKCFNHVLKDHGASP